MGPSVWFRHVDTTFDNRKSASQVLRSFVADEDENDRKSDFTSHGNAHVWNFVFVLVVTSRTGDGGGYRCGQNVSENVFHFALKR